MRNPKILIPLAVVVLGVGAWLAFGLFGVQYLFIDDKVDEARPDFARDTETTADGGDTDADGGAPAPAGEEISGSFVGRSHPTSGEALVLQEGDRRVLRFEGFETDNGPDLNVYLSSAPADADAGELDNDFVDLGDLKGNVGDQNYEIPSHVDLDKYGTVVIWCVRFNVAFGAAELQTA